MMQDGYGVVEMFHRHDIYLLLITTICQSSSLPPKSTLLR